MYKAAGAKYFFSMGCHHDNFDMWNSKHQHWNAANMGPKKDIVGLWQKAAKAEGMKFGVSDHLWITYKWFSTSHGHDTTGPLTGVPYDGADPKNFSLYVDSDEVHTKLDWNENGIPTWWREHWYKRMKDLVDNYEPDILYIDGDLSFEEYGLNLVAHHYNLSAKRNGGKVETIYTSKRLQDSEHGIALLDVGTWRGGRRLATSLANRHLYRRLALQPRDKVQNAEDGCRPAGGHRKPERKSTAELPASFQRHVGFGRIERAGWHYRLDEGE